MSERISDERLAEIKRTTGPDVGLSETLMMARELTELREEVAAARKLWDHLKELREPWGEYQDAYVEFGLLERVEIPDDAPVEERCEDCDGECGWCYRDSGLIGPLPGGDA